jgi:phosphatidylserine decarboxylase
MGPSTPLAGWGRGRYNLGHSIGFGSVEERWMKFAKYGMRELAIYGGIAAGIMIAALILAFVFISNEAGAALAALPFIILFVLVASFFRDPKRIIPKGEHRIVSPADGTIYDIGDVDEDEFIGEPCTRIGIFLSVFDCHLNRIPCSGTVEKIVYKKGKFINALKANECSAQNESNMIGIGNAAGVGVKVAVKQIAGAIARRIVCDLEEGQEVTRGDQYGMIKFGSRTELFIPKSANFELKIKLGQGVKAGRSVIGNLEPVKDETPDEEPDDADTDVTEEAPSGPPPLPVDVDSDIEAAIEAEAAEPVEDEDEAVLEPIDDDEAAPRDDANAGSEDSAQPEDGEGPGDDETEKPKSDKPDES